MLSHKKNLLLLLVIVNSTLFAQIEIKGKIVDSKNKEPLSFVTVFVCEDSTSSQSDFDGNYKITARDNHAILEFLATGYKSKRIKVDTKKVINVFLEKDSEYVNPNRVLVGKPVIYLYPPSEMEVELKLHFNGSLLTTYPLYKTGWQMRAKENGLLINKYDNKEYSYLFWEGTKNYLEIQPAFENGFVVSKDSALTFLQHVLPQTGLVPKEYNEFIVFWLPYLESNELSFVHFRTGDDYNVISQNEVTPEPDVQIRVFMEFKKLNATIKVQAQIFDTPKRKGFTLVEWGGAELKNQIIIKDSNMVYQIQ